MYVRKARTGSTSLGYTWDRDGQIVEVRDDHAMVLLGIRDGGFSLSDVPEPEPESTPITEPAPAATLTEPAPVKATATKATKTA